MHCSPPTSALQGQLVIIACADDNIIPTATLYNLDAYRLVGSVEVVFVVRRSCCVTIQFMCKGNIQYLL